MENLIVLILRHFIYLSFLGLLSIKLSRGLGQQRLPLIFSYSPESPIYIKNLTRQQRIEELVRHSISRARYVSSPRRSTGLAQPERTWQEELFVEDSVLLLKVGIGTFDRPITYDVKFLHVDTGSDVIWIQCEDCLIDPPNKCFGNPPLVFENSESSTYRPIHCGTHEFCYKKVCEDDQCPYECIDDICSYHLNYFDGTNALGYLAFEKFTFGTNPRGRNDMTQGIVFDLVFGCNFFYEGPKVETSEIGLFGLGWGSRSFISQIKDQVDDTFSYCFPRYDEVISYGAQGYLNLGLDNKFNPKDYNAIALRRYGGNDAYYLNLNGISVAGKKLEVDPSVFVKRGNTRGTVIDSGASFSSMVAEAYEPLKTELIAYFQSQGDYQPVHEASFDLCYKTSRGHAIILQFPSVTLHFDGGDLLIPPENVYIWDERDIFCLAMIPPFDEGITILGAYQQSNFHFVFDRRKKLLFFQPQECHFY